MTPESIKEFLTLAGGIIAGVVIAPIASKYKRLENKENNSAALDIKRFESIEKMQADNMTALRSENLQLDGKITTLTSAVLEWQTKWFSLQEAIIDRDKIALEKQAVISDLQAQITRNKEEISRIHRDYERQLNALRAENLRLQAEIDTVTRRNSELSAQYTRFLRSLPTTIEDRELRAELIGGEDIIHENTGNAP